MEVRDRPELGCHGREVLPIEDAGTLLSILCGEIDSISGGSTRPRPHLRWLDACSIYLTAVGGM